MSLGLTKIQDSTAVHEFPTIHNENIEKLERKIVDLEDEISEKDAKIEELKTKFNAALNALRAEYIAMIDDLKNKIENN